MTEMQTSPTARELTEEIAIALSDTFVAKIERSNTSIRLKFMDGKTFCLAITEG